jgi:hypothetical protein
MKTTNILPKVSEYKLICGSVYHKMWLLAWGTMLVIGLVILAYIKFYTVQGKESAYSIAIGMLTVITFAFISRIVFWEMVDLRAGAEKHFKKVFQSLVPTIDKHDAELRSRTKQFADLNAHFIQQITKLETEHTARFKALEQALQKSVSDRADSLVSELSAAKIKCNRLENLVDHLRKDLDALRLQLASKK